MAGQHIDVTWDPTKARINESNHGVTLDGNSMTTSRDRSAMSHAIDDTNDDMPAEIDFSGAQRGKFFRAGAVIRVPVYLDAEVRDYLAARADAKGVPVDRLVNDLLKKNIELIEAAG